MFTLVIGFSVTQFCTTVFIIISQYNLENNCMSHALEGNVTTQGEAEYRIANTITSKLHENSCY